MLPALLLSCFLACRRHHSRSHFVLPTQMLPGNIAITAYHEVVFLQCVVCQKVHCRGRSQTNFPDVLQKYFHSPQGSYTDLLHFKIRSKSITGSAGSWCTFPSCDPPNIFKGCQLRSAAQAHQPAGVVNILEEALILRCYTHSQLIPGLEDAE